MWHCFWCTVFLDRGSFSGFHLVFPIIKDLTRRSNQSILKELSPEYSLQGLMVKLKLQYLATWCEELSHLKRPWFERKDCRREEKVMTGWDVWMASPTQWIWVWVNSGCWWWSGSTGMLQSTGLQKVGHDWATEVNLSIWQSFWQISLWI